MATEFCAGVIGDEQYVGAGRVRRRSAELIAPSPQRAAAAQFPCNQAHGLRVLTRLTAELKVHHPNFSEREQIKR